MTSQLHHYLPVLYWSIRMIHVKNNENLSNLLSYLQNTVVSFLQTDCTISHSRCWRFRYFIVMSRPPPTGCRHNALMGVVCLFVCLSVRLSRALTALSREWKGVWSWKMTGRKRDPWPHLDVKRSNACRQGGGLCSTGTSMSNGRLVYYELQAESHHALVGTAAYCVGPITGRTAGFDYKGRPITNP